MSETLPRDATKGNRLKQLRAFVAAAKTESMSKAADELALSQPSVSLQIRALEEELGTVLFERRGPRIRVTPEGRTLYELARPLIEGVDALPQQFSKRLQALETGEINIAAGESTILYILPPLVKAFSERYPGVHVHLHNVTGRDGLAMIRADEVDFAVGSMLDVPGDIRYAPAYEFNPMLIAPLAHPLAEQSSVELADLAPYGLILPPKRLTTWRLVDLVFHQNNVPYRVALEVGGWEVIKKYVETGLGISIVTSICLTGDEALIARDMSTYFPTRSYGVVMRKGKYLSPPARRFIELVDPGSTPTQRAASE